MLKLSRRDFLISSSALALAATTPAYGAMGPNDKFDLVIKGGDVVGPNLSLLRQYFPGYRVTFAGAFIGAMYAFVAGLMVGWVAAAVHNVSMFLYWVVIRRRAEHLALRHFLEII